MGLKRIFVSLGDFALYRLLQKELFGMETVLDLGCGDDSPIGKLKKNFYSLGVDGFAPSIAKSKKKGLHDEYKKLDLLKINENFRKNSFDAVIALDVVEHFPKKEGLDLLDKMENIAKKKVIVLTPYGFVHQDPYEGNPYQVHKSGWTISDFRKRGYNVFGVRGFRFIRGEYATIKYKPWLFWGMLSTISELIVHSNPGLAYQIFAVKEK